MLNTNSIILLITTLQYLLYVRTSFPNKVIHLPYPRPTMGAPLPPRTIRLPNETP